MELKVIVLDIDGTLYNSKREICKNTKDKLIELQKKGIKLVLASGRPYSGMVKVAKDLSMDEYDGLIVCYNGSKVVNAKTNKVLFNKTINIEVAKKILNHLKNFKDLKVMIDNDGYMYVEDVYNCFIDYKGGDYNVIQYESRGGSFKLCEVDSLEKFIDFEPNKILTAATPSYLNSIYKDIEQPFKDVVNSMFTSSFYFEFTAKNIDKAAAIDSVISDLGYSKENVIAFGDSQNDISMLKYAQIGVAMGNAVSEVKEIADIITLDNDNDGIFEVLEKYFK